MSKGLEALERIGKQKTKDTSFGVDIETNCNKDFEIIERIQAFEIIKEHKLLNYIFKNEKCANMYHLSKEEINLLKEVML